MKAIQKMLFILGINYLSPGVKLVTSGKVLVIFNYYSELTSKCFTLGSN